MEPELSILNEFVNELILRADSIRTLPAVIDGLIYDPRFNVSWVIDCSDISRSEDEDLLMESNWSYSIPIGCVVRLADNSDVLTYVCDSDEIGETDKEVGDFNYSFGFINDECPILFHQSSHQWAFPNRVIFYTPKYQFEVCSCQREILVYETVHKVRSQFFIKNKRDRIAAIKDMLLHSDRPSLYTM